MTETFENNKKAYIDFVSRVWNFDDESMAYIEKRLSPEWEPVPELKELINLEGGHYEDQRITFDLDMTNPLIQSFFVQNDESYKMFREIFRRVISFLDDHYGLVIGYQAFIENKAIFKKNTTKIKKIFEVAYAEYPELFDNESGYTYTKEKCAQWIVKQFERIGACKKSAKKLQFVISFNPIDWLMSSTGETWSSCFNINNHGGGYQYCLGLPFLCGDKNRMLLYITDGSEKELEGMKCHHYQTRTWCILDKSGTFNIVKWYPNDTIGVKPVNSITGLNNFCDKDSFREGKYPLDVLSTKKGAVIGVYSDMGRLVERDNKLWLSGNGKDGQQLFTKNLIDLSKSNSRHSFHFGDMPGLRELGVSKPGYELPKWRKLGIHVDMFFTTLKCSCGSEKGGFLFRGEKYLCQDCYKNNVFTCGSCGNEDYISKDKEIHTVVTTSGETIKLCDSCWETRERHTCSCCGKYSKRNLLETDEGTRICPECLNNNSNGWSKCDTCGKISRAIRYVYNSFTKTSVKKCNSCKTTPEMQEISTFGRYFALEEHRRTGGMSSNE